ncbi:apoptosis-associated speck-like protein containing a CARD [Gastrophryne carolinensis]
MCDALLNLESKDLKRFRNKLNDWTIKEGYEKIPRGTLEGKDADDVVTLMLDYYEDYAPELMVDVLIAINQRNVAKQLQEDLAKVTSVNGGKCQQKGPAATSSSEVTSTDGGKSLQKGPAPTSSSEDEEPFVDRHRVDLISDVYSLGEILDSLLQQKLLQRSQYNAVRAERNPQEQMRQLFDYIDVWGKEDKYKVYQILKKHNGPLIRRLESC